MVPPRHRVLVVEDDVQLANLYCRSLVLRGVECVRARDGFSALRSIEQQRPSLIVLDLNLPNVSGYTVLDELAHHPETSAIPVIVVTGVEPTPSLPHALIVIGKPCEPDYVAKMAADHLPLALG